MPQFLWGTFSAQLLPKYKHTYVACLILFGLLCAQRHEHGFQMNLINRIPQLANAREALFFPDAFPIAIRCLYNTNLTLNRSHLHVHVSPLYIYIYER